MNATIRGVVVLLAVIFGAAAHAAPQEPHVRVSSSRDLRVAVIDSTKASATRDAVHQTFAASLGASLSRQYGAPIGVHAKCVGVDHAAFNLGAGVYDAILVIGRSMPDALRRADVITLSATPETGKRDRMIYLLIGNGDTSLQGLLALAFTGAINDEKFLESFASLDGKLSVSTGAKVAAAQ